MNPALRELLAGGAPPAGRVAEFLGQHAVPLVAPDGVTFVYLGEADAVNLRCFVSGLPAAQPLERIPDTELWVHHMELPEGSRIEYKFERIAGGHAELILDPLNALTATDPFGANSVCQGWGYERPPWTLPEPTARRGTLETIGLRSEAFGERRELEIYLPARFRRSRRYALLIVHDGVDYLRYAALQTVLDNLIHRLEIAPLIVALTRSPAREREYAGHDEHARFLGAELLPWLQQSFPLEDSPDSRGLMGASFGAVAALHTAWRHPGLFGRLLLQSGSFAFSELGPQRRGPVFEPVARFVNEFRSRPGVPASRIYVSCGIYESLIHENRALLPLLQAQGMEVRYEEARDGHNWENWRDRLRSALSWLFPGPMWLVYE